MNEVTAPVIAIVLVLCAVFIPVSFMGGLAGQMYKQFAITISVSVVLSGIVALTLTPSLCALLLKPHAHDYKPPRAFTWFNYAFGRVTHRYLRAVRFIKDSGLRAMILFGAWWSPSSGCSRWCPAAGAQRRPGLHPGHGHPGRARPSTGPRRSPTP